ncbi:hypothetical protein KUV62_07445 [Salipiger bermudensis]|uniref:hypothetical protein n=1 Tax=Salipiger bermudensis TaxID=344736 RepID=UPI001C99D413|nr:hypothetical protein [Salipiger bermudensis]MBY6003735.1 hypothetical protein [Salipiger bermudensis]
MRWGATLALVVAALPAAAVALEGLYRPAYDWADGWDCRSIGREGGAVVLTPNAFIGVGSRCSLADPTEVRGMQARLYDATCREGTRVRTDRIMVLRTDGGIAIIRGGAISLFAACP